MTDQPSQAIRADQLRDTARFLRRCRGTEPAEHFEARAVECYKAVAELDRLTAALARVQALPAQWREEAERDYRIRHDDTEDGIWAYQHEASGRCRKGRKCADDLEAALSGDPAHSTEGA